MDYQLRVAGKKLIRSSVLVCVQLSTGVSFIYAADLAIQSFVSALTSGHARLDRGVTRPRRRTVAAWRRGAVGGQPGCAPCPDGYRDPGESDR